MVDRKHPDANCEECPLYHLGRYVPTKFPESGQATIAFVGEAPGPRDARAGQPFSSEGGKLLSVVMKHHGIDKDEVVLTNAVACKPPANESPDADAVRACRPRVAVELRQAGVRNAVALGNSASLSLLGKAGVTKLRVGAGHPSTLLDDVHVTSTFHPAAALRQGDFFPYIVNDVGKLVVAPRKWEAPTYVCADTEGEALAFLEQLEDKPGPYAVDIEVGIEKDTSFDHPNNYDMLCVGIAYEKSKVLVLGEEAMKFESVRDRLGDLFRRRQLIFQNGKFDKAGLYPSIGEIQIWFDTMLASYTFDERPGVHSLDYQGQEHMGTPDWKSVTKKYTGTNGSYALIPRPILYRYNAFDVSVTYDLWEWYEERYKKEQHGSDLRQVHDFLVRAANQIVFIEMNGFSVDRKYLAELEVSYLDILEARRNEINEIIGWKQYDPNPRKIKGINPNSPKQIRQYLLDMKIDVDSTNEDTMNLVLEKVEAKQVSEEDQAWKDEVLGFCKALMAHRTEAKLYGTYVKGIRKRLYGGRVHPTYNLHGTTTGRLACRNPNLQNIPRDSTIRRLFVPSKPENVLIGVDYSQAELRVLSYLAGDTYFRNIFNADTEDVFDNLTPLLYPEAVKPGPDAPAADHAAWRELRIRVKAYVYGLAYGRKHHSIAQEYNIPVAQAKKDFDAFFAVIPEIVAFRDDVQRRVLDGEELVTPWGRHRRFTLITKDNHDKVMNEALAFMPQSTASDMCVDALVTVRQNLRGVGYIRNIVHDALYVECHEDDAEEVSQMVSDEMLKSAQKIVGDYVKFKTDAHIGRSWGEVG